MTKPILPDLLKPNLKIVFCGTAASPESARRGHYYAGPSNRFWEILYKIRLTDRLLKPSEFEQLLSLGIGLTDIAKKTSGVDSSLDKSDFNQLSLKEKIEKYQPQILCFNGKRSAEEFLGRKVDCGSQFEMIGNTKLYVAPSTSGAARRFWDQQYWFELINILQVEQ